MFADYEDPQVRNQAPADGQCTMFADYDDPQVRNQAPAHGQCTMFADYEDPQVQKPGTSTRPMYHVCWL